MSITLYPTQFPPQTAPFVDPDGKLNNNTGNPFLVAMWQRTGSGTGIVNDVEIGLLSNGASALELISDWNEVTLDTGHGAILPALVGGQSVLVFNNSGGALLIAPPIGASIDGVPLTPYSLPNNKMQIFFYFSDTNIRSCQLG